MVLRSSMFIFTKEQLIVGRPRASHERVSSGFRGFATYFDVFLHGFDMFCQAF